MLFYPYLSDSSLTIIYYCIDAVHLCIGSAMEETL